MTFDIILMYSVVSFLYIISPGPAIFLAISNGLGANMKVVSVSSLGNIAGLFILSAISISGLGALMMTSATLFMVVKTVGAGYLIYLGIKQLKNSKNAGVLSNNTPVLLSKSYKSYFAEAFFLAVTNPKPILFFTALFPQFLNIESAIAPQFFVLTGIFMLFSFMSLCGYGMISKVSKSFFIDPVRMAWFHRITGGVFVAMGISLFQLKRATD